ncbi:Meiosis Initiator Protein [Manis pentadactyla]|nr:Meiosis Initiator Protein [Manis pentadactyla]
MHITHFYPSYSEEERETSWLPSRTTSPVPPWGSGWCFSLPFAVLQGTRALEGLAHLAGNCPLYKEP